MAAIRIQHLSRFAPVVLILLGLAFAAGGGWAVSTQRWTPTVGTIETCETRSAHTSTGNKRRVEQSCVVTWKTGGSSYTDTVTRSGADLIPGQPVNLRIDGDDAVLAGSVWPGIVAATIGIIILIAGTALLLIRRRPM